ncbi:hypothetical protein F0562_029587, partial [Nyssa sinensis]
CLSAAQGRKFRNEFRPCDNWYQSGLTTMGWVRERSPKRTCVPPENFVGVPEDDGAVPLSVSTEQHAIELVDLRRILDDFMTESSARITNIMEDVMALTDVVKINLKSLED